MRASPPVLGTTYNVPPRDAETPSVTITASWVRVNVLPSPEAAFETGLTMSCCRSSLARKARHTLQLFVARSRLTQYTASASRAKLTK